MPEIFHDFPVAAPPSEVFRAITTPEGLSAWWTKEAEGDAALDAEWRLDFGPGYAWRATVCSFEPGERIEWELVEADPDWLGARVSLRLEERGGKTWVHFHHTGWPEHNDHYRISCFCWAMYLRLLRIYVETGQVVPYEARLDA